MHQYRQETFQYNLYIVDINILFAVIKSKYAKNDFQHDNIMRNTKLKLPLQLFKKIIHPIYTKIYLVP